MVARKSGSFDVGWCASLRRKEDNGRRERDIPRLHCQLAIGDNVRCLLDIPVAKVVVGFLRVVSMTFLQALRYCNHRSALSAGKGIRNT